MGTLLGIPCDGGGMQVVGRVASAAHPMAQSGMVQSGMAQSGMADSRIGVARLDMPEQLPPGAPADGPKTGGNG